ncbi:hypothetical protein FOA52_013498 [Chlamydomonas sp. UWO 241]|nr:hypothetical protein FOA52_013498 [Chlamydomonas sp. UWO 241]
MRVGSQKGALMGIGTTVSIAPQQAALIAKAALMSFDEDGEDGPMSMAGVPKAKKNKEKKRGVLRAQTGVELSSSGTEITQRSAAGEYSTDRLRELQRNAISYAGPRGDPEGAAAAAAGGGEAGIIKVQGSFKVAIAKDDRYTLPSALAMVRPASHTPEPSASHGATASTEPAAAGGRGRGTAPTQAAQQQQQQQQQAGPSGGGVEDGGAEGEVYMPGSDEEDGAIPDAATIKLAKEKRGRLRQAHLAPDYVPLNAITQRGGGLGGARTTDGDDGEEGEGCGGSGDDGSGEEPEESVRMKFTTEAQRRDMGGLATTIGGDEGEPDDEESFEQAQLRKAVARSRGGLSAAARARAQDGAAATTTGAGYDFSAASSAPQRGGAGAASGGMLSAGARQDMVAAGAASALAALRSAVTRANGGHANTQSGMARASGNLTACLGRIEGLEVDLKRAGDKYVAMQKVKTYVADLCDCLAAKSLIVEELEDDLAQLRADRASATMEASRALERELQLPADAAVAASLAALGRRADAAQVRAAAAAAAADAEDRLADDCSAPEIDEFGRNVNLQREKEAKERAKLRASLISRELAAAAAVGAGGTLSTDDAAEAALGTGEDPAQARRYAVRYRELMDTAATVFLDAGESFSSVRSVKGELEDFKLGWPKEYEQAYMSLSTPALFAPYVRLELLHWDPLFSDGAPRVLFAKGGGVGSDNGDSSDQRDIRVHKGFDALAWYEALFDFGLPPGEAALPQGDADGDLLPSLVRRIVLPASRRLLDECWSPGASCAADASASQLLMELLVYVPADDAWEELRELMGCVTGKLEAAAARAAVPPWPPAVVSASPAAEAVQFRRFRHSVRLIRCVAAFDGVLSRQLLVTLAVSRLAVGQCLAYARAGLAGVATASYDPYACSVSRLEAVASALPLSWFEGGAPPEAAPLVEHCSALCRAFEAQSAGRGSGGGGRGPLALRAARVAQQLGDGERAARLAGAYGLAL